MKMHGINKGGVMEEIKIGEYVRTETGKIGRVISIDEDIDWIETTLDRGYVHPIIEFKKHSKNIIDLIEVGDYVNESKLISINYAEDEFGNCDKSHFYYHFEDDEKDVNEYYDRLIIKSIVTKEQFENMEYRLEEQ